MSDLYSQLILAEQKFLFDVWKAASAGALMPSRQSFTPCAFGPLLPYVSLFEFNDETHVPRIRVAGSALKMVFGANPVEELMRTGIEGALDTILQVKTERKPAFGTAQNYGIGKNTQTRVWMRLPLGTGDKVCSVIGLDLTMNGSRLPNWAYTNKTA